jgi:F1F0 ATPase subunit 2
MPDAIPFVAILLVGAGLGMVFFGGLLLTVRAARTSRYPAVVIVGSFWIRTAVVVGGFLWITGRRWQNAIVCLLGFAAARLFFTRYVARPESNLWI